jgi:hypothetical protein
MHRQRHFLLLVTLAAAVSTPALGQDRSEPQNLHIAATIGQQVRVHGHVRFVHNCSPDTVADMTIVTPPKLGELSTKVEIVTLTRITPPSGGECLGRAAPGRVVYYTAQACGHDTFHYDYEMSSLGHRATDWTVTVDIPCGGVALRCDAACVANAYQKWVNADPLRKYRGGAGSLLFVCGRQCGAKFGSLGGVIRPEERKCVMECIAAKEAAQH